MPSKKGPLFLLITTLFSGARLVLGLEGFVDQKIHKLQLDRDVVWGLFEDKIKAFFTIEIFDLHGGLAHEFTVFKIDRTVWRSQEFIKDPQRVSHGPHATVQGQ